MGSACRAPCVLLILRTFLLSDPLSSYPPNLSSFRSFDPPNPPSPGGGLPPPLPPPWPRLGWWRLDPVVSADLFFWFFRFLGPTFCHSQIMQKLTSQETSSNPKNQTHGRPEVDFYTIYDDFWPPIYEHFSYILSNCEKLVFEQQYGTLATFSLPKSHLFALISHQNFIYFWDTLQDLIFLHFMLASCRNVRFWDPFKIQRVPRCHPKSAQIRNFVKQMHGCFRRWRVLFATCFSKALRAPPLPILDGFGLAFDSLFDRFRTLFCFIPLQFGIVPKVERSQYQCPSRRQKRVLWKWVGGTPEGITITYDQLRK